MDEISIKEDIFNYLDALRDSGQVNMYGSGLYVSDKFNMELSEANTFVKEWMETFSERQKKKT